MCSSLGKILCLNPALAQFSGYAKRQGEKRVDGAPGGDADLFKLTIPEGDDYKKNRAQYKSEQEKDCIGNQSVVFL